MARARLIHPEFSRHEGLAELAPVHRLLFALLPTIADREGLLEDRPRRIKADLFPYDTDLGADVDAGLAELARIGCIQRVEMYGRKVITIPGFLRWNKPHPREKHSELSKPGVLTKSEGEPKANLRPAQGGKSPPVSVSVSVSVSDPVPVSTTLPEPAAQVVVETALPGKTVPTRKAYEKAYRERWGTDPLINRTVNGQLAKLIDAVGVDVAPELAAFYVRHNWSLYVNAKHPIVLLLRDAPKIFAEWQTDNPSTMTEARTQERTEANFNGWGRHLSTAKAGS